MHPPTPNFRRCGPPQSSILAGLAPPSATRTGPTASISASLTLAVSWPPRGRSAGRAFISRSSNPPRPARPSGRPSLRRETSDGAPLPTAIGPRHGRRLERHEHPRKHPPAAQGVVAQGKGPNCGTWPEGRGHRPGDLRGVAVGPPLRIAHYVGCRRGKGGRRGSFLRRRADARRSRTA